MTLGINPIDIYRFASPIKRWNFENMARWQFWKPACAPFSTKKKGPFSNYFEKKGPFSNWVWKNTPGQGPGGPGQGPGPRPQWGIFFKLSLKMNPFFKIFWKRTPFFIFFWKEPQVFRDVTEPFVQVIWQLMGAEIAKDSCRFTLIYINLRWFTLIYVDLHRFTSIYVDLRQDNSRKLSFSK